MSRWHQRRSGGDTRKWLFTILHNLAVNHLRRAARRCREVPLDDAGESDVAVPSTQEDVLRRDDILGAVGQLPDDHGSVIIGRDQLHLYLGYVLHAPLLCSVVFSIISVLLGTFSSDVIPELRVFSGLPRCGGDLRSGAAAEYAVCANEDG